MQPGKLPTRDLQAHARTIYQEAVSIADVRKAVTNNFHVEGTSVISAGRQFDLQQSQTILTVAIGKAATPMYEMVAEILQTAGWPSHGHSAILVSPRPPSARHGALQYFEGAHPTPNQTSRQAAAVILSALHSARSETLVLFLVSGGASSMVEMPLDSAISEADVAEFNRCLVGSDLSIAEINSLRKHLSAVKGGRMAEAAAPAWQCTLIVSDVPPASLDIVGSGPSLPDSSSKHACTEIYGRLRLHHRLPPSIERAFERGLAAEMPRHDQAPFAKAAWKCILSSEDLSAAAAKVAASLGFHTEIDNTCDEWTSKDAADYLLSRSAQLSRMYARTCLISVGEVAVHLRKPAGAGGRNQHFALQCALRLASGQAHTAVLSAGSDGIDGNSPAAGAIVTEDTCDRALARGIDPVRTLELFDSFHLFDNLGDTIVVGPTGNNLRDLRLVLT